jgi:hypothetical protein
MEEARKQMQAFLSEWQNAEQDTAEIIEAKQLVAQ